MKKFLQPDLDCPNLEATQRDGTVLQTMAAHCSANTGELKGPLRDLRTMFTVEPARMTEKERLAALRKGSGASPARLREKGPGHRLCGAVRVLSMALSWT